MQYFRSLCCVLLTLMMSQLHAQQQKNAVTTVTGWLKDSALNTIEGATVKLMQASDTANARYQLSDSLGQFIFTRVTAGTYVIDIQRQSFASLRKYISVNTKGDTLKTGPLLLPTSYNNMEAVTVTSVRPVTMNGDTTEFNADAYAVKPDATAGDLLNKMSGLEVDEEGKIQSDGEAVTRVYVNGKPFFGDNPAMATKNLPADAIKKIQVYDAQTDQSKFTGFDDGRRIKTINIVTRRKFKGWFGRPSVALGSGKLSFDNPLYRVDGKAFLYGPEKQWSLIAKVNNISGSQAGKSHKTQVGTNYRDIIGKKTKVSGSYKMDESRTQRSSTSWRQDLYTNDTVFNKYSERKSISKNINHHFSFNWETKFDTMNELYIRPRIGFGNNHSSNLSTTAIDSAYLDNEVHKNKTAANSRADGSQEDFSLSTTYNHRFKKRGRSVSLDVHFNQGHHDNERLNTTNLYDFALDSLEKIRRTSNNQSSNSSYRANLDYTEPFGDHHMIQLELNAAYSSANSDQRAFNYDELTQAYSEVDTVLTNNYGNTYQSTRTSLNYRFHTEAINLSFGSGVKWGKVHSDNRTKATEIHQDYINLYPTATLTYHFNKWRRIRFRYDGRTSQPSIQQMQPIVDHSNPLYVRAGNPDLKQRFNHHVSLEYKTRDSVSNRSISAHMDMQLATNSVVNSIRRLDNGGQYSQPININGNYSLSGYLSIGLPVKFIKSNLDLQTRIRNRRFVNLIDQVKNFTTRTELSETFRWRTNLKETFDVNFTTRPTYNLTSYSVSDNKNGNYFDQRFSLDGTWYAESGWESRVGFHYTLYAGLPEEEQNNSTILNLAISRSFAHKAAKLALSVKDLLNQSQGLSFTRTDNYIQQSHTDVFRRYFLLTFTYNLKYLSHHKHH